MKAARGVWHSSAALPRDLVLTEEFEREQAGSLLCDIAAIKIGGLKQSRGQLKMDSFHNHNLA
jgi:hypothetical protein